MSSVEHQNAQKLEFLQKPPVELIFKNMRIWYLNENVDIVHLEKIPKDFENVSVGHQNDRKRVDWTGFWSRWVPKSSKMSFRKDIHPS